MDFDENLDREAIRSQISTMSFEQLQKLKDKMGAKLYNEKILNHKPRNKQISTEFKRANKNRPREMSSKTPFRIQKESIAIKTNVSRDPRFDPLCGSFEEKTFRKNYKFVNEIKKKEREALIKELKETEDEKRNKKIKFLIQRMDNQQRELAKKDKQLEESLNEKQERKMGIKKGEKPVYQKKSEKSMMNLLNQYEELKQTKKLKKHIEKKSKKISTKEKIKLNSAI